MRYIGLTILFSICIACQKDIRQSATPKVVHIEINRIPTEWHYKYLFLFKYQGEHYKKVDSTKLGGYFLKDNFLVDANDNGVFKLGVNLDLSAPFIIGYEKVITIKLDFESLLSNKYITIINSNENVECNKLIELQKEKVHQLLTYSDPFYNTTNIDSLMEIMQSIETMWQSYNLKFDSLNQAYPTTFCTKVILPIFKMPIRPNNSIYTDFSSFLYVNYFNEIDLSNPAILNLPYFKDFISEYLRNYNSDGSLNSAVLGAVNVLKKNHIHPEVAEFMQDYIIGYYVKKGEGDIAKNIYSNVVEGCSDELMTTLDEMANRYKGLTIGGTFPEFNIIFNGKAYNFKKLIDHKQYLFLYFWRSGCHACEQEHRNLLQSYEAIKSSNLKIVGISLDEDSTTFYNTLHQLKFPWQNISDFQGTKSPLLNTLKIATTPTTYLVDKDQVLIKKNASIEDIFNVF